jgi:hypothetical protein
MLPSGLGWTGNRLLMVSKDSLDEAPMHSFPSGIARGADQRVVGSAKGASSQAATCGLTQRDRQLKSKLRER